MVVDMEVVDLVGVETVGIEDFEDWACFGLNNIYHIHQSRIVDNKKKHSHHN